MRVTVDLDEQDFKKLQALAVDERRSLREQAAWLLGRVLSRDEEQQTQKKEGCDERTST